MTTVVLLGGNGYIGRTVTEKWLEKDKDAQFIVLSRSGKNVLKDERIENRAVDVTDLAAVQNVLPEEVDYIVNFIGAPSNDETTFANLNTKPAAVTKVIAQEKNVKAIGFIGGLLGPKKFLAAKKEIAEELSQTGIYTAVVEPTVVYGNGRSDTLAKLIPLFKLLGNFNQTMKPVHVEDVADELLNKLLIRKYVE